MKSTIKRYALLAALVLCFAGLGQAEEIYVTDATDLFYMDEGAVYKITDWGQIELVAYGFPLMSPSGILYDKANNDVDEFFVTDIGGFYDYYDGGLFKVTEDGQVEEIFFGYPFTSPFGILKKGCCTLYVSDFGSPFPGNYDGAVYKINLDPDEDGQVGPYPLDASAIVPVYAGFPLEGVNQMLWLNSNEILMADDSGTLHVLDLKDETVESFGPDVNDPVGLARLANEQAYVVADALGQMLYFMDWKGTEVSLELMGTPGPDQFLGVDVTASKKVVLANAGDLGVFGPADGEVIIFDDENIGILYSGDPLISPFCVEAINKGKSIFFEEE
ncbi:hypothetical protein ACFLU6_09165 [Acidobacteriota bacterium]